MRKWLSILFLLGALSGCQGEREGKATRPGQAEVSPVATTQTSSRLVTLSVSELVARPDVYVGQTVVVVGRVEELISPNVFKLDEDSVGSGGLDNDLVVLSARSQFPTLDEYYLGRRIRVTGTVYRVDESTFEEHAGAGLDEALFTKGEGKLALLATAVELAE